MLSSAFRDVVDVEEDVVRVVAPCCRFQRNIMGGDIYLALTLACVYLGVGLLANGALLYPSVQWSFQNPGFKEGRIRLNVLPMSKVNIICPHMATSLVETEDTSSNLRYENFWKVDNSSYHSCDVNTKLKENRRVFQCKKPLQIYFEQLVFQSHGMDNALTFTKGKTYYFISTSTGTEDSLNNTKGGHCLTDNMKMEIYICNGSQDPLCNEKTEPTTVPTKEKTNNTGSGPNPVTQAARTSSTWDIWHLLTIVFGVSFAASLVVHSLCLFFVCQRRSKKKPSSSDTDRLNPETEEDGAEKIQVNQMSNCQA